MAQQILKLADACVEALNKLDPKNLERRFPTPALKQRFESAKGLLLQLMKDVDANRSIPPELLVRMEEVSKEFHRLRMSLSEETQLYGKSAVNEIVHWAEAGYVERSIYFAGLAHGRRICQPYYTQIQLLPVNACLHRYRQCNRISEELSSESSPSDKKYIGILQGMKDSYLFQLEHFSRAAYADGTDHPMAPYFLMLVQLLRSHELSLAGHEDIARRLVANSRELLLTIPRPVEGIHYMHAQYHLMNYEEFTSFSRLSTKHADFACILKDNCDIARSLQLESKVTRPAESYNIMPYVIVGARASLVTLSAAVALAAALDLSSLGDWISNIWATAVSATPGVDVNDAIMIAHTGGVANAFSVLAHTGGVAV